MREKITVRMKRGDQYRTVKDIEIRYGAYQVSLPPMTQDNLLRLCIEIENTLASVLDGVVEEEEPCEHDSQVRSGIVGPGYMIL